MEGGFGSDDYYVDHAADAVTELDFQGVDAVYSSVAYRLGDNVENLFLLEEGGAIDGIGNDLQNVIIGNTSDNTLSGERGNDILQGGRGNDILAGGADDDDFGFFYGDGIDWVRDFVAGDAGGDVIGLFGYRIGSLEELQPHMSQQGSDVVISFDAENQITLANVSLGSLNHGDFLFG
jgi:Ca2+-binding RTX toxin-like protein